MAFGYGYGYGYGFWLKQKRAASGPFVPISYPLNQALWTANEATDNSNTRKVQTIANIPFQAGYEIGEHHSTNPAGNIAQIGLMTWDGSKYTRTSTNPVTRGSNQYNRLARRLVGLGWEWITGPADTKSFTTSDVPDAPTGSWAALSSGVVRVTLGPWNGQRRAVTGGEYQIGSGSWVAFTAAASGSNTIVDVPGLTDGVETGVNFRWVNANVDSTHPAGALSMTVIAQGVAPVPVAPRITYLVDGSGTAATVLFDVDGATPPDITAFRYRIGAGSSVVVSGSGPLPLTGLSASQAFEAEWTNATGYSATTAITLVAALPAYTAGMWTLTDGDDAAGDVLIVAVSSDPTPIGVTALIGREYQIGSGAWLPLPIDGAIHTGTPEVASNVRMRAVYDIGPSIPGDQKTATPTYPIAPESFPAFRQSGAPFSQATATTALSLTPYASRVAGDTLIHQINIIGNPTYTIPAGWTVLADNLVGTVGTPRYRALVVTKEADGTSADVFSVTLSAASRHVWKSWCAIGKLLSAISAFVSIDGVAQVANPASVTLPASHKAHFLALCYQLGSGSAQALPPSGYTADGTIASTGTSTAHVRAYAAGLDFEAGSQDPAAFGTSVDYPGTYTLALWNDPSVVIAPTTTLTVDVAPTSASNGQPIVFSAAANGAGTKTYALTIDGNTYTNTTGVFSVTPTPGSRPWSMTATNATGSASASGTVTVTNDLAFAVDAANPFLITVNGSSVTHDVTPASYRLEWQTADGGSLTTIDQTGASFPLTFPSSGAYRCRLRAIAAGGALGSWSDYLYYWVYQQGAISWFGENAQAVQVSPLSVQAPLEVIPVTSRQVRLHEVRPAVTTEVAGGRTYYLNGVVVNPPAYNAWGPHGWDNRLGGRTGLIGVTAGFSLPLVNTTWPRGLSLNDTVSKFVSRPTALLDSGNEGHRGGLADQHGGLVIVSAFSTTSPMQASPAIIKHGAWTPGSISLPGYQAMADALTALNLSTSGMTVPPIADVDYKMSRFDPSGKVLRGALHSLNDTEAYRPWRSAPPSLINYRDFELDNQAAALLVSNAWASDVKIRVLQHLILRGIQWDYPGANGRVGAGITQDLLLPISLSRIARGISFDDLATTQCENAPHQYGFWDATTAAYLGPHNDPTKPLFALRRQISSVLANSAVGHQFTVPWNVNSTTGERKQRFNGLNVYRESTGEELPYDGGGDMPGTSTENFGTNGFFSTPLTVGEWVYLKIPAAAMSGFAVGEPFWMYDTKTGIGTLTWDWNSFNPSPSMSYRVINQPHGSLIMLHALGAYPGGAGSKWDAMKRYTIKTALTNWPGAGSMNYPFTGDEFVSQMWTAHAATLGIT